MVEAGGSRRVATIGKSAGKQDDDIVFPRYMLVFYDLFFCTVCVVWTWLPNHVRVQRYQNSSDAGRIIINQANKYTDCVSFLRAKGPES